jgi:hypothetical protein
MGKIRLFFHFHVVAGVVLAGKWAKRTTYRLTKNLKPRKPVPVEPIFFQRRCLKMLVSDYFFWFAVLGASVASIKHGFFTHSTLNELTPAIPDAWWGGYAFSLMNMSFAVFGIYVGYFEDAIGKQALLLCTGLLFIGFSFIWFTKGSMTGNVGWMKQGFKIAGLGILFLFGFYLSIQPI